MHTKQSSQRSLAKVRASSDEAVLMQSLQQSDQRAFEALYRLHVRAVYLYSVSIVRSDDAAEEICQDVWLTFWRKRADITLRTDSPLPWLLVTTRNKSLTHRRDEARAATKIAAAAAQQDSALFSTDPDDGLLGEIDRLVSAMPEVDQKIFALCVEDNLSYSEAASRLNVGPGVIRNRLHRLRITIRQSIANTGASE